MATRPPTVAQRISEAYREWVTRNTEDARIAYEWQQLRNWKENQTARQAAWWQAKPRWSSAAWKLSSWPSAKFSIANASWAREGHIIELRDQYRSQRELPERKRHEPLFSYFVSTNDFRENVFPAMQDVAFPTYQSYPPVNPARIVTGQHKPAPDAHYMGSDFFAGPNRDPDSRYFYNIRQLDAQQHVPTAFHSALASPQITFNPTTQQQWVDSNLRWLRN
jgi:hypothetical protein